MAASFAPSARPPGTAIAWATRDSLFVEIPCRDGPPYVTRYHRTAAGLAAALNILIDNPERPSKGRASTAPTPSTHPAIRRPKPTFTEDQREGVRQVLKGLKII